MITYSAQGYNVAVGSTATLIVAANKDRSYLEIGCTGADPMYLGGPSVDSSGFPIKASGPHLQLSGVSATAAVYGANPSGNGVFVFEVTA